MTQANKTFRVFVSSTFSDLKEERNALQRYVFPRLTDLAKIHGCRFQAIDLRWGISEEAGLDQRTMQICLNELARCQKSSPRPNFIVLLGDRYGWEPLPEEIPEIEFDEIKKAVDSDREAFDGMARKAAGLNTIDLLEKWYRLDLNAVPPVYVLQPRTGPFDDYATWEREAERPLRYIFREAVKGLGLGDEALLKYDASATHQEIERGAMQVEDAVNHVFGFFRRITNLDELAINLPDTVAKDFVDSHIQDRFDKTAHDKLQRLKDELRTKIGQAHTYEYEARWAGQGVTSDHIGTLPETLKACEALLNEDYSPRNMCEAVWRELAGLIKAEVEKIKVKDTLDQENEAHGEFRKDRAKVFIGREYILGEIDQYTWDNRRQPLAIYGASGTGKSALMAKAVQNLRDRKKDSSTQEALIIERFIGATPESTNIHLLLEGLCKVINRVYAQEEFEVPEDFNKLVQAFEDRMTLATSEKPLLIFLDALDQLSRAESAHNLNWLPSELPPNVKIIVSTLPEPYPFLDTLKVKLPPENVRELELLSPQHGEETLEIWLTIAGRTLQEEQRREVLGNFSHCGLPLYLKLAFEEAKKWHSYNDVPEYEGRTGLAKDIPGIIGNLFWRLSLPVNHGNLLVERSLGYLAAAKNGLTEDEMLDVLSRDEEFYTGFKDQSHHEFIEDRLPVIIWSRLYFDLEPYLTERAADGTSLLSFYHRQLSEIVTDTYLAGEAGQKRHRQLARYFNGQKHKIESGDKKTPNLRKLSELPYQQTQGEMWDDIEVTLTDLLFIEAKCTAGMTYNLIADYNAAFDALPKNLAEKKKEKEHAERIRKYTEDLIAYARGKIPSLDIITSVKPMTDERIRNENERIMNNPTGLDKVRAFSQFVEVESHGLTLYGAHPGFCIQQAYNSATSGPVAAAAEDMISTEINDGMILHHPSHRVNYNQHTSLLKTFEGHTNEIRSVNITPDGKIAASGSWDTTFRVWDIENGQCLMMLEGHNGGVESVSITPDVRKAVSGSYDKTICVWDIQRRECLKILEGHTDVVSSVSITPAGEKAASGSWDNTLRIWDIENGQCLMTLEGHTDRVSGVSITPDARKAVSGSDDKTIRVWDIQSRECLKILEGHTDVISSVSITPDGKKAASGSWDSTFRIWDIENGQCLKKYEGYFYRINSISITPDGKKAISGCLDKTLQVWDIEMGECLKTFEDHGHEVSIVKLTPDGKKTVSGSGISGTLRVWDIENGGCLKTFESQKDITTDSLCITPDGDNVISGSFGNSLHVWDIESGQCLKTLTGHKGIVDRISIVTDGKRIVSGSDDNTLRVWDIQSGRCVKTLRKIKDILIPGKDRFESASMCITPDGKKAVSGSWDKTLRVWDIESGQCLKILPIHTNEVGIVNITPDGKSVISGSGRMDNSFYVWDIESGECLQTMTGHELVVDSLCVTPDGKKIASGSWDNMLYVWDLKSGQCLQTLTGHTDMINRLRITPDGKKAVSTSMGPESDNTLRVWDIERGQNIAIYRGRSIINSLSGINPSGQFVCGAQRGDVIFFKLYKTQIDYPIVTPIRIWLYGKTRGFLHRLLGTKTYHGHWDDAIKALCSWCGQRGPVSDDILNVIEGINRNANISPFQSPCHELPSEAWDEPRLRSECPLCHKPLRFNPFVVDNRDRY